MRRGINPLAILILVAFCIAGLILAVVVGKYLPVSMDRYRTMIRFVIFVAVGGAGALIAGRFGGRR